MRWRTDEKGECEEKKKENKTTGERKKSEKNICRKEEKVEEKKGNEDIITFVCIPNFFVFKEHSQKMKLHVLTAESRRSYHCTRCMTYKIY